MSVKKGVGEGFELDRRYNVDRYYSYYDIDEITKLLTNSKFELIRIYRPKLNSEYHTHSWIGFLCRKSTNIPN